MGADQSSDWHDAIASALDWWRAAGVDVELQDDPRDWLAPAPVAAPISMTRVGAPAATSAVAPLPATIAAYAEWRIGGDVPEAGWGVPLLPTSGPVDAPLMILIEAPEREDAAAGRLLAGPCGRLFDRMLAAIGLDRDRVHLASIAAARPVSGRIPRDDTARLAELTRHYVSLVRPRVLLLLGNAPCQVMLEDLCHASRGRLLPLNHDGATLALASFHPGQLIERPQLKAESWKDLQMLQQALAA